MSVFYERLKANGFTTYDEYLASERWKEFKRSYRRVRSTSCVICETTKRLHFHHHTYVRLCDEELDDITILCDHHHDQVHACLLLNGWKVEQTADAVKVIRSGQVFDVTALHARRQGNAKAKEAKPKIQRKKKRKKVKQRETISVDRNSFLSRLGELRALSTSSDYWLNWTTFKTCDIADLKGHLAEAERRFGHLKTEKKKLKERDKAIRKGLNKSKRLSAKKAEQEVARKKVEEDVSAFDYRIRCIVAGIRRR